MGRSGRIVGAAAVVVVTVAAVVPFYGAWSAWHAGETVLRVVAHALSGASILLGATLAALLLRRAPPGRGATRLVVFLLALPVAWGTQWGVAGAGPVLEAALVGSSLALVVVALGALVAFAAEFPRPLTPDEVRSGSEGWTRALRSLAIHPRLSWLAGVVAVAGALSYLLLRSSEGTGLNVLAVLMVVPYVVGLVAFALSAVVTLRLGYRVAPPEQRPGVLWVFEGGLLVALSLLVPIVSGFYQGIRVALADGPGGTGLPAIPPGLDHVLFAVLLLAALVCFAMALLYHGTIDPAMVVRRTTVYGVAGALLPVLFAATETAMDALLADAWGGAGFVASVALAVALSPLLRRLDRSVRRRLGGTEGEGEPLGHDPDAAGSGLRREA